MSPLPPRPNFGKNPEEEHNVFEEVTERAPSGLNRPRLSVTPPAPLAPPTFDIPEEVLSEPLAPNLDFLPTEQTNEATAEELYGSGGMPTPPQQVRQVPTNLPSLEDDYSTMDQNSTVPEEIIEPIFEEVYTPAPVAQVPTTVQAAVTEEVELEDELEDEELQRKEQIDSLSQSAKENAQRLLALISDDESSEVLLNGPNEIMYKVNGQRFYDKSISFDSIEEYHTVINTIILYDTDTAGRIGTSSYLIEGQLELPDYEDPDAPSLHARVHVLAPPAVKAAKVTIAKKAKKQFQLEDLAQRGAMNSNMLNFLKALGRGRATVVFSGLSGSGKTTLLEAMSYSFDPNDRVIVVEDTAELRLPVSDIVPLLSTSRKPGLNENEVITLEWLVAQANRMRPDRIIVGEIRGGEIAEFLSAANSGADGSMTTVHASSPNQTNDKMLSLAMKSTTSKSEMSVLRDISSTVQIIVQTALIDGKHIISEIQEVSDTIQNGRIGMQPIFQYDRRTGRFATVGRPSDKLQNFLNQRGVNVENSWFSRVA